MTDDLTSHSELPVLGDTSFGKHLDHPEVAPKHLVYGETTALRQPSGIEDRAVRTGVHRVVRSTGEPIMAGPQVVSSPQRSAPTKEENHKRLVIQSSGEHVPRTKSCLSPRHSMYAIYADQLGWFGGSM